MMQVARLEKWWYLVLPLVLLFSCSPLLAQDEESLGRQAEQAGKLREGLTHYVAALQSASEGSDTDQRLREKIISLAQRIKPTPAVPEEARRHFVVANTYMKDAKSPQDYGQAVSEYKKALLAAPWFGDAYHNLGIAFEAAGNYVESEKMLKLYLATKPNDSDARAVQDRIYEVEAKLNEQQAAQREAEEKRQAAEQAARAQARAAQERRDKLSWLLDGSWNLFEIETPSAPYGGTPPNIRFWGTFLFVLEGHSIAGYAQKSRESDFGRAPHDVSKPKSELYLRGELQADDPGSIRWTIHHQEYGGNLCEEKIRDTWVDVPLDVSYDKRTINFSVEAGIEGPGEQCRNVTGRVTLNR
jgi:hypothetical protein